MNLRGLLNAQSQRAAPRALPPALPAHPAQLAMQHAYHQSECRAPRPAPPRPRTHVSRLAVMGAYSPGGYGGSAGPTGRRSGGPRTPSPAPPPAYHQHQQLQHPQPPQQHQPAAKWHIPQQGLANGRYPNL